MAVFLLWSKFRGQLAQEYSSVSTYFQFYPVCTRLFNTPSFLIARDTQFLSEFLM